MGHFLKLIGDLKSGIYITDNFSEPNLIVPQVKLPSERLFPVDLLPTPDRQDYLQTRARLYPDL